MNNKFIVLSKTLSPARDVLWGAFGAPAFTTNAAVAENLALSVKVTTIERSAIPAVAARKDTVGIAPVIPMQLISPVKPAAQAQKNAAPWGLQAVGANNSPYNGEGIVVAVLDTGIDANHAAFKGVNLIQQDFTGEGNGDQNGHGTHCAGIIFGRPVDGMAIGVAPGITTALICKVLDKNGSGSSDQIVQGILWAIDRGAHIISISIGMNFPAYLKAMLDAEMPLELATSRALEGYLANTRLFDGLMSMVSGGSLATQPTIVVAASGNEARRDALPPFEVSVSPPGVARGVVSVAAVEQHGQGYKVAYFSNTGANVSAPGVDIVSAAAGGGLRSMSGTSMAAPCVAGVAALWAQQLQQTGSLTSFQLLAKLGGTATAATMDKEDDTLDYGAGLVQCPQV